MRDENRLLIALGLMLMLVGLGAMASTVVAGPKPDCPTGSLPLRTAVGWACALEAGQ